MKYLSSSNGWKNKSAPTLGDVNELFATVRSLNCFLNWTVVFVTSRLSIFLRDTGVTRLFDPILNDGDLRTRSFTSSVVAELPSWTPPPQTPVTVETPITWISVPLADTPTIRLNLGTVSPGTV